MRKIRKLARFFYQHKLIRYLFVGGTTFTIDILLLLILHEHLDFNIPLAATISYWVSIGYNFSLNRSWTFSSDEKRQLHKNALLYGVLLTVNYFFTVVAVSLLSHFIFYGVAKLIVVIIQTSWTYYLYKNYVFGTSRKAKIISKKISKYLSRAKRPRSLFIIFSLLLYTALFFSAFKSHSLNTQNNIDGSWSYAIASFRHHEAQSLGNDVFFTYGPLSTKIVNTVHHLDTARDYFVSIFFVTLIYGTCVYLVSLCLSKLRLAHIAIFTTLIGLTLVGEPNVDILFFVTILIALPVTLSTTSPLRQLLLLSGPILLSLYKNNLLIAILFLMIIWAFSFRSNKKRIVSFGLFTATYYLMMIALGISYSNVPQFLTYSVRDALAYNEFMSLSTNQAITIFYFVSLLFFTFSSLAILYAKKPFEIKRLPWHSLLLILSEVWILWVVFKEASTRSDGHIIVFLPFLFYIAASLLYKGTRKLRVSYAYPITLALLAFITLCSLVIVSSTILRIPKRIYAMRTIKNVLMYEVYHQYSYTHFKAQKFASQQSFNGLTKDTAGLRESLGDYADSTGASLPPIVGYTNTIFYLPAVTDNYRYGAFLQNYQTFPTSIFDNVYKKYLIDNPETLVFWTNINPGIDGRIPNYDLPDTFKYIQESYTIVASDAPNGLYVFGKKSDETVAESTSCNEIVSSTYTNTPTPLDNSTVHFALDIHDFSRLPIDMLYKKPVYMLYLFDDAGNNKIYRTTPSLIRIGIETSPFIPSLLPEAKDENFIVSKFMVSASDQREVSVTVRERTCIQ